MTRQATWSNPDGLVVGFGNNYPERMLPAETSNLNLKVAKLSVDAVNSVFGASGVRFRIPAGGVLRSVLVKFTETHAGGTSITFGDGSGTTSIVTAAQWGATPAAGTALEGQGAYMYTATEGKLPGKAYAAATDLYFTKTGTYTSGKADVYIEYFA